MRLQFVYHIKAMACGAALLTCPEAAPAGGGRSVRMRLELDLGAASCRTFENFTLVMRIVNPNPFPVILPGFEMGYIEPEVHVLGSDDEYHRLYYGAMESAWTRVPKTIAANNALTHLRFLYGSFAWERWPNEPGVFTLRAKTQITTCQLTPNGDRLPIEWENPTVRLRVEPHTQKDGTAMDFLIDRLRDDGTDEARMRREDAYRVRVFAEFLQHFEETAYAPEIRWQIVKLLTQDLGNRGPLSRDPRMAELWKECLTACLDRGGAFTEEFSRWDPDRGGSDVFKLAAKFGYADILMSLSEEVDRKYPDDEPARLFRRVLVNGKSESLEAARSALKELSERFPTSQYVRMAEQSILSLERPQKRPDETKEP